MKTLTDRTRLELEAGKRRLQETLEAMTPEDRAAAEATRDRMMRLRKLQEWSQKGLVGMVTEHLLGAQGNRQLLMRINAAGPHTVTVGDERFEETENDHFPSAGLFARVSLAVASGQGRKD